MPKCHQFERRESLLESDLQWLGLTEEDIAKLRTGDFSFKVLEKEVERKAAKKFIEKYEWLGNIGQSPLHYFGTYYGDLLGGVILMSMPNTKHHLLGTDEDNELLISRGACASWTPKNLASKFLMECIDWCVKNTQYRVFTSYADTEAGEMGTIYQACRFYYLGNRFGTKREFFNPYSKSWVSERGLRRYSMYRNHAKKLKIEWRDNWTHPDHPRQILWKKMPQEVEQRLREYAKDFANEVVFTQVKPKHKYAFVKGKDRRDTQDLRKRFFEHTTPISPYPKRNN